VIAEGGEEFVQARTAIDEIESYLKICKVMADGFGGVDERFIDVENQKDWGEIGGLDQDCSYFSRSFRAPYSPRWQ